MKTKFKFKEPIYTTRPILPDISKVQEKIRQIWESKWISNNGSQHNKLESEIKKYLKVPNVSLFNNGTLALLVALRCLKLSGEVITTPFTFPATPHSISWSNLKPIFCDIDENTMNINPKKIECLITKNTSAILGVHVFGTPCDVESIQRIADYYRLKVIYDAAHAFGVEINGTGIGNFGDISMFSFHATKLFHTAEGGALVCKKNTIKLKFDLLKNFGIKNEEEVTEVGINGKMNEIQAALGQIVLKSVGKELEKRKLLLIAYHNYLEKIDGIRFIRLPENIKNSYQNFNIRIDKEKFGRSRDYVYEELKKYNIFTRKYFYPLCSNYPHYNRIQSARRINLPVANKVADEALSMPFYGGISLKDVEKICDILIGLRYE